MQKDTLCVMYYHLQTIFQPKNTSFLQRFNVRFTIKYFFNDNTVKFTTFMVQFSASFFGKQITTQDSKRYLFHVLGQHQVGPEPGCVLLLCRKKWLTTLKFWWIKKKNCLCKYKFTCVGSLQYTCGQKLGTACVSQNYMYQCSYRRA